MKDEIPPIFHTTEMCRGCLSTTNKLQSIFNGILPALFNTLTSLPISKDDRLPATICSLCAKKLNEFNDFQRTCKRSDQFLRQNNLKIEFDCAIEMKTIDVPQQMFTEEAPLDKNECFAAKVEGIYSAPKKTRKPAKNRLHKSNRLICDICNEEFSGRKFIVKHMQRYHSNGTATTTKKFASQSRCSCPRCGKLFPWPSNLRAHMLTHNADKNFMCDICSKKFISLSHLNRHQIVHTGERKFECTVCKRKFTESGSLKAHMVKHSGARPYVCTECPKTFVYSLSLRRHTQVHSGTKPYLCSICSKQFNQLGNLKTHLQLHLGARPHVCAICSESFAQSGGLKSHMITHTGAKDYVCNVCGRKFGHMSNLRRHKLTHSDERPHACDICDRRFRVLNTLNRHKRTHLGERPFVCSVCGKALSRATHLKKHMLIHVRAEQKEHLGHIQTSVA